ncbi:hypothetical protein FHW69_003787 [Luteibacter sp. Sphag1AF]|uniref:hypothetical protein n=1 Tax=Luteibacter sp. Sphag1AF TaxID=2587031 RepID=UPI0016170CD1|nr:hypothetical protein [Luteibacter sp. Sphag1AF]MBB3229135.1 hypothetical protein [Luteibacter sp. Sphag1AF]
MSSKMRKVTAVGLLARDELLVRTLLKVVTTQTTEAWSFHDGFEANVALCNPDSALSMMAIRRASSHGLLCVSVVHDGGHVLPETLMLRAPIRSSDFIDVLNRASGRLQVQGRSQESWPKDDERYESVAQALSRLKSERTARHARIEVQNRVLVVEFRTGQMAGVDDLTDADLVDIAHSRSFTLTVLDERPGDTGTFTHVLDRLLWLSGLHGASHGEADVLPDRRYQLRRWPDAGSLPLQSFQLHMAAVLSRQAATADELASRVQRPLQDAEAFLNGCAMLGVLDEVTASMENRAGGMRATRKSFYGDLFHSLRTMLGIRRSAGE